LCPSLAGDADAGRADFDLVEHHRGPRDLARRRREQPLGHPSHPLQEAAGGVGVKGEHLLQPGPAKPDGLVDVEDPRAMIERAHPRERRA
jgi:hypothetical protein